MRRRQWLPETDPLGRATGRRTCIWRATAPGVLGTDAAEARGRLAAHALMTDIDISHNTYRPRWIPPSTVEALTPGDAGGVRPLPDDFFAAVSDETLVCRCEQVLAGELRGVAGLMARAKQARQSYSRSAWAAAKTGVRRCGGRNPGVSSASPSTASGACAAPPSSRSPSPPSRAQAVSKRTALQRDALVISAGIVGYATALQLARRGKKVTLIEARPGVRAGQQRQLRRRAPERPRFARAAHRHARPRD
jgi:hypothetical protein